MSLHHLLLHQMQSLQAAGYEVVGISSPGEYVPTLSAVGIRHIPVTMTRKISPWQDLIALWRLYRVFRRERPAIVHTHNPKPGLLGQLAARLARVPVVVNTLHGFYFHEHMSPRKRRFYILMERIAALCSDVILSQNREDMQTATRERIGTPALFEHLGNGIDLAQFDPARFDAADRQAARAALGIPAGARVVGFVGRLTVSKGFADFLAAAGMLGADVHFIIVGGADTDKADAIQPDLAQQDRCHFLGWQPNAALPPLYACMDVLALPSLYEGMPRVLMEAAAMGLPSVATNVKGCREVVIDGQNGFLVPLGDVPALADAIRQILDDPTTAQKMGAAGRQMALAQFDEQRVFQKVRQTYERLLGLPPIPDR